MNLSVLYRGPLSSCNYECAYCPFAKHFESDAQLDRDKAGLGRFVARLTELTDHSWKILFTPWGEALVRAWYRRAIVELTQLPHVESVAVQTNLSCPLDWIQQCRIDRLALWTTYHPTQTERAIFLRKIQRLREWNVRVSVGVVGLANAIDEIIAMRQELPQDVYLWINAQQPRPRPYSSEELKTLTQIDPLFDITVGKQRSLGQPCRTGETVFTVDGQGDMRRCHFVDQVIGHFYHPHWQQSLQPRLCPKSTCHCFLGLAHLNAQSMDPVFGPHLLERIPNQYKMR